MKKRNWKVMSLLLAGTMLAGTLTGCGSDPSNDGGSEQASGDVVDIKWVMVGNGMPSNYDAWKAKLDAYLEGLN